MARHLAITIDQYAMEIEGRTVMVMVVFAGIRRLLPEVGNMRRRSHVSFHKVQTCGRESGVVFMRMGTRARNPVRLAPRPASGQKFIKPSGLVDLEGYPVRPAELN
jgi:hypothetical protein